MAGVYILCCADETLYVGCTKDIERRLREHNAGRGGRYTRGRRPVRIVYWEGDMTFGQARRRETALKGMNRRGKLALIRRSEGGCDVADLDGVACL